MELDLGVGALDAEHSVQLGLLDAFAREAREQPEARESGAAVLRQLLDYTQVHFLSEQLLMRLHAYPGYEAHVQEHERLLDELRALAERYSTDPASADAATLRPWLESHVRGMDHAFGAYLRAQARSEA